MEESNLKLDSNSKLMNSEVTWIHSHSRQFKTKTTEIVTLHFSPNSHTILLFTALLEINVTRKFGQEVIKTLIQVKIEMSISHIPLWLQKKHNTFVYKHPDLKL